MVTDIVQPKKLIYGPAQDNIEWKKTYAKRVKNHQDT